MDKEIITVSDKTKMLMSFISSFLSCCIWASPFSLVERTGREGAIVAGPENPSPNPLPVGES